MMVVGLCGGIGSGKTVASDHFMTLGIDVIDTDIIAREVVMPGKPALNELIAAFGQTIVNADGTLNRAALRDIAFANQENKRRLDSITHPAIRRETLNQIKLAKSPYCLVVIPLLAANSPFIEFLDRILVVTAPKEVKIQRVQQRSQLSREEVIRIMESQISDEERLKFADDVIENHSSLEHVYAEVEKLNEKYLNLTLG